MMYDPNNPRHHIVRIDIVPTEANPNRSETHGWQVRVSIRGERKTKFFADRKYGGRDKALEKAVEHREVLLAQRPKSYGPEDRRPQARNTSGVPGIRLTFKRGLPYVEANWVGDDGRQVASFSVERYGLRKAAWNACKARAQGRGLRSVDRVQSMFEKAYPTLSENLESRQANDGALAG